jgi:hypothetical protein
MSMVFIKAVLMSILSFYRLDLAISELPKEFTYLEYKQGRELGKKTIKEGDAAYFSLKKFISEERQGWRYDFTTYAPNHVFRSPKMEINCLDKAFVINYEDNGDWIQISKKDIRVSCPSVTLTKK